MERRKRVLAPALPKRRHCERSEAICFKDVMPGEGRASTPGDAAFAKAWMAGPSPAMTSSVEECRVGLRPLAMTAD
jgi:hypothetical protein